ncbi:MAG TPA: MobF family relaxase [Jiangellaceae bacterium]|nr:MobF family relaxase [Jiangellaceae bacterium]
MRAVTLKAAGDAVARLIGYYADLGRDQLGWDRVARGPVDYYLDPAEPPGRWWGSGCPSVGLEGEVLPEQLQALLEGRHPATGAPLGRRFGDKSARGFDATFSAAKSVSVLWALSADPWVRAEVTAAHDAAVDAALGWLERHGAVTRRGRDGIDQVDTQGLVVALFRQHTSRTADPQLHTHAVIWAKVQDPTGRWLALDARFLKYQQRSIGWVYDAALRSELSTRLGITWGPVVGGHADIVGVPDELIVEFSQRSTQVDDKLRELVARWAAEHDGVDPDARTIARVERKAVVSSRPDKQAALDADALRAEWRGRAAALGFDALSLPSSQRELPGFGHTDRNGVIAEALARVGQQGATWLQADVAREIATLLPADATGSGQQLVELVDELAAEAAGRCLGLHPPARGAVARRLAGRPVSEHVTDRRLTTQAILDQEAALMRWARQAAGVVPAAAGEGAQAAAARAVAGTHRLVLVVGPAGAGKTTMLRAGIAGLRGRGRTAVGLAPSGKAADVLARETGCTATTLARFLHGQGQTGRIPALPAGSTVILDEAGMAATEDLARLVRLADARFWRLVCVGDPYQLPAVGRGGMFAHWCDTLPAHHLDGVHRFADDWQAAASLALRRGDPAAAQTYAAHQRLETAHPALIPARVARLHDAVDGRGESLAITCATSATARAINLEIQRHRHRRRARLAAELAGGTRAFVGDQIATRRNALLVSDTGAVVRNRHTWTVLAVGRDGSLAVADPDRGTVKLPLDYVARHVELGWAVTGYGNQGITTDHAICVVEPGSSRAGIYVGMTRGRRHNRALVLDPTGLADPQDAFGAASARPANALTAHAVRDQLYRAAGLEPPAAEMTREPLRHTLGRKPRPSVARGLGL